MRRIQPFAPSAGEMVGCVQHLPAIVREDGRLAPTFKSCCFLLGISALEYAMFDLPSPRSLLSVKSTADMILDLVSVVVDLMDDEH